MKTIVLTALLLLLALSVSSADTPVTMTGMVVDLHCYVSRGAHGPEHAGCSNACISRGVPAGFLADDGTLYLLLDARPFSVNEKVAGKAGQKVTVKGKVVEKSGMKALQLESVE